MVGKNHNQGRTRQSRDQQKYAPQNTTNTFPFYNTHVSTFLMYNFTAKKAIAGPVKGNIQTASERICH